MNCAVIDIGSNSVRLMLWADGKTLYKKILTTRLGRGLEGKGVLSPDAMERTALAVRDLAEEGRKAGAKVMAFATAAVRTASNGGEFCEKVKALCGVGVDVVSGQDEARLAVLGALGDRDGGIVDIGGASTEICLVKSGKTIFSRSLDVGAVRLFDACGEDMEKILTRVEGEISCLPRAEGGLFYAVGGTAATLAGLKLQLTRYAPERLQDALLGREWVAETARKLFSIPLEERRKLKGMDPSRADILGGAAVLLEKIMEKMDLAEVRFSDRDNLEGYLALKGLI